jgi:hypothetical protein
MRVRSWGILLLCIAVLSVTVACSRGGEAPNGMTGAEILEMSQNASVNTAQFSATVEASVMGEAMTMYMTGAADDLNREMYMTTTAPEIYDEVTQIYIVDDWIYTTDSNGDWIKTELTDDIWEEQNLTSQQMGLMEGFLSAKYLGMENIGGFNCYKVDIDPDWDAIFAASDAGEIEGLSTEEIIDMIKETSCMMWIAENTYFPTQIFFSMTMEMDILGQKYSVTTDMTMTFSNINQPVTITLPAAANNATAISYEDFMSGDY